MIVRRVNYVDVDLTGKAVVRAITRKFRKAVFKEVAVGDRGYRRGIDPRY